MMVLRCIMPSRASSTHSSGVMPRRANTTRVVVELGVHRAGAEGADVDGAVHLPQLLSHAAGHVDHIALLA